MCKSLTVSVHANKTRQMRKENNQLRYPRYSGITQKINVQILSGYSY